MKYGKILLLRYMIKSVSEFSETRKVEAHKKALYEYIRFLRIKLMILEEK